MTSRVFHSHHVAEHELDDWLECGWKESGHARGGLDYSTVLIVWTEPGEPPTPQKDRDATSR